MNDAPTNTYGDGLSPVSRVQFLHDVLEVSFHCLFRDLELFRNIAVAISSSHLTENVHR